jgi:extradiol dioxygenase family protein
LYGVDKKEYCSDYDMKEVSPTRHAFGKTYGVVHGRSVVYGVDLLSHHAALSRHIRINSSSQQVAVNGPSCSDLHCSYTICTVAPSR